MGSLMSKAMEENFEKNKVFMAENQTLMMERQLQMQNQMREKAIAMQLSGAREMFNWYASFYSVAVVGCISGFLRTRKPSILVPLIPMSFVVGYQYDYTHGSKIKRIQEGAKNVLTNEKDLLAVPLGLPSIATIDAARESAKTAAQPLRK